MPWARRYDLAVLRNPGYQCPLAASTRAIDHEVLHLPTLDQCRELAGRQDGISPREATQGHHRLVRRQNDGIGSLRIEHGDQVFRRALMSLQVANQGGVRAGIRTLSAPNVA